MKQLDVLKKIGGILQELNDQYDYLKAENSNLNELELELFVANAHFLKDHAEILRKMQERDTPPVEKILSIPEIKISDTSLKIEPIHERRFFEPVVQQKYTAEPKTELAKEAVPSMAEYFKPTPLITPVESQPVGKIDITTGSTGDSYSFERQEPEIIKEILALDEASEKETLEAAKEPSAATEVTTDDSDEVKQPESVKFIPVDINDTDDNKILTVNQKISAQKAEREQTLFKQIVELPITDLKSAINLNDKLLYIKDLFNGYTLAYSEAIEIVNRFNTFEEAERFLKTNYTIKNNWDGKPATAEKFYALLKRRYPAA